MIDRGIIKWQPFDSCYSSKKIINDIANKKNKVEYPTLSEDQLYFIEEKITSSFYLKENITLEYFCNGKKLKIFGKITFIDSYKKILFINNINIYFKQIINII